MAQSLRALRGCGFAVRVVFRGFNGLAVNREPAYVYTMFSFILVDVYDCACLHVVFCVRSIHLSCSVFRRLVAAVGGPPQHPKPQMQPLSRF